VLNGNRVIAIRARSRRGWSIRKIARTFDVSRKAVRRYTRPGRTFGRPSKKAPLDIQQELDLVRSIARRWRTPDPDELESELTDKLGAIYHQKLIVDDWKAFVITALNGAAINWLRGTKRRERHIASRDRPLSEGEYQPSVSGIEAVSDVRVGDELPIRRMHKVLRKVLPPFLRRVWNALVAENFDQGRAAVRLGMHRNTIGKATRQIWIVLMEHGF
jgi:transcriptional regulator with XRE-family HTH domain